jgi:hypothetical protein
MFGGLLGVAAAVLAAGLANISLGVVEVEAEEMLETAGKRDLPGLAELLVHHQLLIVYL